MTGRNEGCRVQQGHPRRQYPEKAVPCAKGPRDRAIFSDLRRQSHRGRFARRFALAAGRAEILAGLLIDLPQAELDLAAVVKAEDLDLDLIADLDDVRHLADALLRQLADMDEPVAGAQEVHEGAEIDDLDDLAGIDH